MPWANTPEDRRRSDATYDATYRRNRTIAMRRDKWRCQLRLPGCIGTASQCDHIVQGAGSAVENLRAVCAPCHQQRTTGQSHDARHGRATDPPLQQRTAW